MQAKSDTARGRVFLTKEQRTRLDRELDLFLEFVQDQGGPASRLTAIDQDRELVVDAWALIDAAAGKDAPVVRVRRIVNAMYAFTIAELSMIAASLKDQPELDTDVEREACNLALFALILAQIDGTTNRRRFAHRLDPRVLHRRLRASFAEGC